MICYDVLCYRCRESETGSGPNETEARAKMEAFKTAHRAKCGAAASFSSSVYSAPRDALLGVAYPDVEGLADDGPPL